MCIKVLTIEDDPEASELVSLLLRSSDIEVVTCTDSRHSVEMVRTEKPDIVLLDLMMPEPNGWEIFNAIRAFSNVPIAILSALDDPAVISNALDAGADDYMVKPVQGSILIAHINNLTRRHRVESGKSDMIYQTGALKNGNSSYLGQKPLQA